MSLKVPCKYCGKEISLRKMPSGQFVPFDKWTNSPHQCQNAQAKTANKSSGNTQQTNASSSSSVGELVLRVITETPGLKAKSIASAISRKHGVEVDKSEVNRWLYSDLKKKVYQNGAYEWFPGKAPSGSSTNRTHAPGVSPESGSYYGRQFAPLEESHEVKTGLPGNMHPSSQQGSNKLLWGIIALLVVIVMILLNK